MTKQDLYPVKSKDGLTIITPKNVLIGGLIIALLYLIMCNGKRDPIETPHKSDKELVKEQKKDEAVNARINDSFRVVMAAEQEQTKYWQDKYNDLIADYIDSQNEFSAQLSQTVPDTCKQYQDALISRFNKIIQDNANKDNAAKNALKLLQGQIKTKDNFLNEKDAQAAKLKANWDDCITSVRALQTDISKLKPRSKVAIGVVGTLYPVLGYGVGIDYIHKRGIVVSGSAMILNDKTYVQAGIKKVISFKKQ